MLDILIGFLTGIVSGLGIGGGSLLMMYLSLTGYEHFDAVNINLTYFVACAVPVVIRHLKQKVIGFKDVLITAIPACIASAAVTLFVAGLNASLLKRVFGLFAVFVGIREFIKAKRS